MLICGENPDHASLKSGKPSLFLSPLLVIQGICIYAPQSLSVYFPAHLLPPPTFSPRFLYMSSTHPSDFCKSGHLLWEGSSSLNGVASLAFSTYNNSYMAGSEFLFFKNFRQWFFYIEFYEFSTRVICSHFTDMETEAHRVCPASKWWSKNLHSSLSDFQDSALTTISNCLPLS